MGNEKKEYQLIATYVKQKYFISTIYRQSSAIVPMWYFETMVWEWDNKTRERGKILEQTDSGMYEGRALENHFTLIKKFSCA